MSNSSSAPSAAGAPTPQRRSFLVGFAAAVIGAVVTVVPTIPSLAFLFHPLLKKKKAGSVGPEDGYVPVTSIEAVPMDGSPRAFPVQMDVQDAWNKFPNRQVGSVFLSKDKDGNLKCFSCVCPHLGCTINYEDRSKLFVCPCHASAFKLDGERENQIPPRSMDPLDVRVNAKNEVEVKYETFRAGTAQRKVVS
jgi:menaquinol-cytochrome c reductase iron-sulfur subunit